MGGTQLADAYVQIIPSMRGVQGEVARNFGAGSDLDRQAIAAGKRTGGLLSKGVGGALAAVTPYAGIAVAGLGIAKLTDYVKDSVSAVANWQALNAQSASAVKATGGAANITAGQVNALAQSLEGQTSTQAETIQSGENLLLTFRNVRNEAGKGNDIFNQTTAAAVDMSRALGTDVSSSAMQLGKALNDPEKGLTRLTRSGVTFTDQQKAEVKALQDSGDTIGAQKIILAELNNEFGGSGAAYAKTYNGRLYQLKDAVGDFGEEIATAAMPALTALVGTASKVVGWAGSLKLGAKAAAGIGSVVQTIGPPVRAVFGAISPILSQVGASIGAVGPQLLAAFKPLLPTITTLVPQLVSLGAAISPTGLAFKALLPVLPQLVSLVTTLATTLGSSLSSVLATILPVIVQLATTLVGVGTSILSAVLPVISTLVTTLAGTFSSVLAALLPVIVKLATVLGSALSQGLTAAAPLIAVVARVVGQLVTALAPVITLVVKLAAQVLTALLPVFLQLATTVLPPVISILTQLIPVITPVISILGTVLAGVIKALLPLITAVFGAIVPIIKAALTIVTGVLNIVIGLLTGNFSQAFTGLKQVVSGAFNLVVGVLKGAVGIIGAAIGSIVNVVKSVFGGLVGIVTGIAGHIIDGFVNGIKGGFQAVVNAAKALAQLLPDWVRKVLGIASPSKVFVQLAKYVGAGLVKGLNGSQDAVKTAATDLLTKVTDAFTKAADNREAAQKRLVKLNKQLASTDTSSKSGAKRASTLRDSIAEQKAAIKASTIKLPKGVTKQGLVATLKTDTAAISSLAKTRDQLGDQLSAAQDKLTDAISVRDDFRDQIASQSVELGNIVTEFNDVVDARNKAVDSVTDLTDKISDLAKSQADAQSDADKTRADLDQVNAQIATLSQYGGDYSEKIADLTDKRNDLAGQLSDQLAKVADYATQTATAQSDLAAAQTAAVQESTPKIISTLQAAITNTNAFRDTLATLKAQGLDPTTYSQLVSAGVAGGGLQAAQELAAAGSGVVQQVASLQAQLQTAGTALGTDTSTTLYQAGVDIAQGSVDGIKAKIVDNQAAIALLEAAMAQSLKTLGVNTSVLTKGVGAQIVAGLNDGISSKGSDLNKTITSLGTAAVKALKKRLGIKSPSRVARTEIGQQFGQGMVLGIEDMHADAERAAAGLASVPGAAMQAAGYDALGAAPTPITQNFNGPVGFNLDEVSSVIATRARRAVTGVNIPKVRVG